jgi:hypothetical protein
MVFLTKCVSAPYFHYHDVAPEPDNDPYTPLAPMAKVPTFPSKIYCGCRVFYVERGVLGCNIAGVVPSWYLIIPFTIYMTFVAILAHEGCAEIIQWMPHGRSWKILNARKFEAKILPSFFDHSKITSFVRQANGWGFRRITKGADRDSYYHEVRTTNR